MNVEDALKKITFNHRQGLFRNNPVIVSEEAFALKDEVAKCFLSHRSEFKANNVSIVKGNLLRQVSLSIKPDQYYFIQFKDEAEDSAQRFLAPKNSALKAEKAPKQERAPKEHTTKRTLQGVTHKVKTEQQRNRKSQQVANYIYETYASVRRVYVMKDGTVSVLLHKEPPQKELVSMTQYAKKNNVPFAVTDRVFRIDEIEFERRE